MSAIVTRVSSDARGNDPEWSIEVVRKSSGRLYADDIPRAEDVPEDVLVALIEWARAGITARGKVPR